jgi:hypothetical protein
MGRDLVSIVESAYALELDTSSWLGGLLAHVEPWLGDGVGLFGFSYSVSDVGELRPGSFAMRSCSEVMLAELPAAVMAVGPDFVRESYLGADHGVATEFSGWSASPAASIAARHGVHDVWSINGRNWRNGGCAVFANRRERGAPSPSMKGLLARVATHLAAAQRLRVRLDHSAPVESAEAVLASGGRVEHATGVAKSRAALDALRTAARSMDAARGRLRRSDPERALDAWKGLVAARWTLFDNL